MRPDPRQLAVGENNNSIGELIGCLSKNGIIILKAQIIDKTAEPPTSLMGAFSQKLQTTLRTIVNKLHYQSSWLG